MTEPIPVNPQPEGGERRRLFILLGVGAGLVLVVLLAGVLVSGGGGDDGVEDDIPRPTVAPDADGDVAAPDGGEVPDETFEIFSTKNPFEPPIAVGPVSPGDGDGDGGTDGDGTDGDGDGGTDGDGDGDGGTDGGTNGGTGVTTSTTAPDGTDGGTDEPRAQQRVSLIDLFDDEEGVRTATVRVNDTAYTVQEGDTFADSYQVVALGEECGDFLFGDSPFELCVGEETLK